MLFEWDRRKAALNLRKHGVSFQEAASVFGDPLSTTFPDPDHSVGERRYITIGCSGIGKVLVVGHTEETDEVVRIITARFATPRERKFYEQG